MRRAVVLHTAAPMCALTGKCVEDWESHRKSFDMRIFELLKGRLTSPTEPLPIKQIYATIANPCRLVEEFTCAKTTRRLGRLHTALSFLRRHNVLLHSLLFHVKETQTWNTTPDFDRLALYGESSLRHEVRARTLRLFPGIDSETYAALTSSVLSEEALHGLFDRLLMKALVGEKPVGKMRDWSLTPNQCGQMLCAIVGEMSWFAARTKATDRTHNNALFPPSDALILHVLCCHVLESLPAELLYNVLEPKVQRIKENWVNEPMSIPEQLHLKPRTIGSLSLSLVAKLLTEEEGRRKEVAVSAEKCQLSLTPERVIGSVRSTMLPRWNYKRFEERRYHILESDKRQVLPLAMSPVGRGDVSLASEQMPDERRRELVALALGGRYR
ncbi:MP44 [Trypanosoma brucei gambiense DAL972]|uniref:MP44 n=1 Tax=Trypanosoma brucei gambiense (strain MHOM/CI/86/DAL972) TaxID=679716 RepID=D0A5N3_TRYB9|nr:MP44 [Trypanosoma brucei gambiense DAL972]CBH16984.1 MP44 [Trypanosoma brucei gambiense DAL972]|eukprot:XP_011779248.1 MP44 [Trypanosoma brucei gambiense DAL972]